MGRPEGFENLVVWQKSMDLVERVYESCKKGALSKDWGLRDQLQRAAVSVPANVAEGYERGGRREFAQFVVIAKGSIGELRCLLRLATRLGCIDDPTGERLVRDAMEISKMLKGLIDSLKIQKS